MGRLVGERARLCCQHMSIPSARFPLALVTTLLSLKSKAQQFRPARHASCLLHQLYINPILSGNGVELVKKLVFETYAK